MMSWHNPNPIQPVLFRTFPIASALRSQLNTQPRNGLKQGIKKQLKGVKYE
jgi:hypothetical protein